MSILTYIKIKKSSTGDFRIDQNFNYLYFITKYSLTIYLFPTSKVCNKDIAIYEE